MFVHSTHTQEALMQAKVYLQMFTDSHLELTVTICDVGLCPCTSTVCDVCAGHVRVNNNQISWQPELDGLPARPEVVRA